MAWYYVLDGTSHGPIAEAELRRLQQTQALSPDTLVWADGMAEWVPFRTSSLMTSPPPAFGSVATQICAECRKPFPEAEMLHYENAWVCAACKPVYFQRLKEGVLPKGAFTYASVWKRIVALILDVFIMGFGIVVCLTPFVLVATWVTGTHHETAGDNPLFGLFIVFVEFAVVLSYQIIFIGKYGATPGKMAMGIKVVRADGNPVTYALAAGRYFSTIISGMICYIGYIMAFFDQEKRALHDHICSTRVINK